MQDRVCWNRWFFWLHEFLLVGIGLVLMLIGCNPLMHEPCLGHPDVLTQVATSLILRVTWWVGFGFVVLAIAFAAWKLPTIVTDHPCTTRLCSISVIP